MPSRSRPAPRGSGGRSILHIPAGDFRLPCRVLRRLAVTPSLHTPLMSSPMRSPRSSSLAPFSRPALMQRRRQFKHSRYLASSRSLCFGQYFWRVPRHRRMLSMFRRRAESMLNVISRLFYLTAGVLSSLPCAACLRRRPPGKATASGDRHGNTATTLLYQLPWGFLSFLWVLLAIELAADWCLAGPTIQMTAMPSSSLCFMLSSACGRARARARSTAQGFVSAAR